MNHIPAVLDLCFFCVVGWIKVVFQDKLLVKMVLLLARFRRYS